MAGRRTGGLGKGLDALIPNKAGGPSKEPAKKTRSAVVKKDKPTEKDNLAAGTTCENFQRRTKSESAQKTF